MPHEKGTWRSASGSSDDGAGAYVGIAFLVALFSVPTYGWFQGIIIALAWPLIFLYFVFFSWWIH